MASSLLPRRLCAALVTLATGIAFAVPAVAADAQPYRVRGKVVSLAGDRLVVLSREGRTETVVMKPDWKVSAVVKADLADIKKGDYVGIASLPTAQGGDGALEVLVFPPAMKGTGEGSYGWDLQPKSTMTNATVADAVTGVDDRTVTVSYQGREKKISVPPGTPVVTLAPATVGDVKPGAVVFVPAEKDAQGGLAAGRLIVGKDGVVPPM